MNAAKRANARRRRTGQAARSGGGRTPTRDRLLALAARHEVLFRFLGEIRDELAVLPAAQGEVGEGA